MKGIAAGGQRRVESSVGMIGGGEEREHLSEKGLRVFAMQSVSSAQ